MSYDITAPANEDIRLIVDNGAPPHPAQRKYLLNGGRLFTDGTANYEHFLSINADIGYGYTEFGDNVLHLRQVSQNHGQCAIRFTDPLGKDKTAAGLGLRDGFENSFFIAIGNMTNDGNVSPTSFKVIGEIDYDGAGLPAGQYTALEVKYDGTITFCRFQGAPSYVMSRLGAHKFTGDFTVDGANIILKGGLAEGNVVDLYNTNATGYSGFRILDNLHNSKIEFGFGNPGVSNPLLVNTAYFYANPGVPFKIFSGDGLSATFGADQTVKLTKSLSVSNTTATWTSGIGSPEGLVSATLGSFYSRTDGGAGSTFYVKESGSLATGWVAK